MDCRQFKKAHSAFLDDTLSGNEMDAVRAHVAACPACGEQDSLMRRALMIARSAPAIAPSADFSARLAARIASERALAPSLRAPARWRHRTSAVSAAVVLLALGAGITAQAASRSAHTAVLSLAPVVVRPPAIPAEPVAAPAMFATVSSNLPVYPAVLLARRATEHFAAAHARTVTFQASR